jgi:hypothetical protein
LAGGFGVADESPLQRRIELGFRRRVEELPDETQRLLLLGAAEPLGDPALLWRAAAALGLATDAAAPAESADLLAVGKRITFRHPLLRGALYAAARPEDRRAVHAALAEATDPEFDPDRRAWHRAYATLVLDEDVAAELERSAERARGRGGLAAAAAFLERAAELTPDPALRAQRTLAAAERKRLDGLHEDARALLAAAEQGPLTERDRGIAHRVRGLLEWEAASAYSAAAAVLVEAARRLEPLDVDLARETHLEAMLVASDAGRLGEGVLPIARAARDAPRAPEPPDTSDLLVDGLATFFTDGYAAGAPLLKRAVATAHEERGREERALRDPNRVARGGRALR